MSSVNDNRLDDLLRRAAEKYPLRTDSADWGKLAADLEKDPSLILPPVNGEDRRRRRRFFWLFLLLPLAGIGYYTWQGLERSANRSGQAEVATEKKGQTGAQNEGKGAAAVKGGPREDASVAGKTGAGVKGTGLAAIEGKEVKGDDVAVSKDEDAKGTELAANKEERLKGTGVAARKGEALKGTGVAAKKEGELGGPEVAARKGEAGPAGVGIGVVSDATGEKVRQHPRLRGKARFGDVAGARIRRSDLVADNGERGRVAGVKRGREGQYDGAGRANNQAAGGVRGGDNSISGTTGEAVNFNRAQSDERELHLASNYMSRAPTKGLVSVNFPVQSNFGGQTKNSEKKNNIKLQKPRPSFYVGIVGSPELSSIKFQSVKNLGTRFGLLLGYSFDSRWAVEAGAYYGTKKYYTDGEYFDKSKAAYVLNHVDDLKVDGSCNMWEIPLNVRYNLSSGGKMKWFATAGVSAYHMSREKYDCVGYLYGNAWSRNWDTTSFPNSWSANINLSVGYEQRLGKIGNLRLEPYVRIPMSGIGTGKLSIMSAGLNIGITRRIW